MVLSRVRGLKTVPEQKQPNGVSPNRDTLAPYKPGHMSKNSLSKNYTCEEKQYHLNTIYTLLKK